MVSLYSRLFTYRQRRDRSPLENFLTEALRDILDRLPAREMAEFVGELFLPSVNARKRWERQFFDSKQCFFWESQKWITANGRGLCLDLVLRCDRQPLIVVENKIGAAVGRHHPPTDEDAGNNLAAVAEAAAENQLTVYGCWLGEQC